MIKQAKDVLQNVIDAVLSDTAGEYVVVRSKAREQQSIMSRKWPVLSLITDGGTFDDREARVWRYKDAEAKTFKERYIRGKRTLYIQMRCWAEGEDETDLLFSRLLPEIPRYWTYDGIDGLVRIGIEEHSDDTGNLSKLFLSVTVIEFSVDVAGREKSTPTIRQQELQPGESDNAM
ncbi:MAG: hypothetical protein LBP69_04025 [Treponema sp.]|jgi:hypothetical protein|nr:hypothetical protein [Treponema sp.]